MRVTLFSARRPALPRDSVDRAGWLLGSPEPVGRAFPAAPQGQLTTVRVEAAEQVVYA
jgi:hypothetical protein